MFAPFLHEQPRFPILGISAPTWCHYDEQCTKVHRIARRRKNQKSCIESD